MRLLSTNSRILISITVFQAPRELLEEADVKVQGACPRRLKLEPPSCEGLRVVARKLEELSRKPPDVPWLLPLALLLFLAGCLVYAPSLSYNFSKGWVQAAKLRSFPGFFMDDAMIKKNPNVYEELNWLRLFKTDYWGLEMFEGDWTHKSFRPLTVLTFRWNHALSGFEGSGFHIVNVLLNVASRPFEGLSIQLRCVFEEHRKASKRP